ncbi:MAG: hypothetical protein PHS93_01905 [Candidatus Omnitrophica bacterium]|nr:hypothetical protein [Candidatus Omnitrophota bacterium]MDD5351907.1 hypothetical protein [Candidatus Omnitrophota bacterium]MDD5550733.1 hypothetical protein [Candidatus Omnitrophota bacterium]
MNTFLKLFGLNPQDIKHDVIITPFINLEYFKINKKSKINKGLLFEVLAESDFSVVKTGVGSSFVGDSVVYLKETACRRIYFIGSCGVVSNFNIGDLIVADKILAWESFSEILGHSPSHFFINAENELSRRFLELNKDIRKANLATLGSLSLQEKVLQSLKRQEIDVVDMEVSAFSSAAKYFKLSSLALLYSTDIIEGKPFSREASHQERKVIKDSRQRAISLICDFIRKLNA